MLVYISLHANPPKVVSDHVDCVAYSLVPLALWNSIIIRDFTFSEKLLQVLLYFKLNYFFQDAIADQ